MLFELEPVLPPEPALLPAALFATRPAEMNAEYPEAAVRAGGRRPAATPRRKAWLPRLIRWVKVRAARRD